MRISEAASTSGIGVDTIRFYEKSGLLPKISRGRDGRRNFSGEDVDWLILLCSLRETGMSLNQMRSFAELYQQGDQTLLERKAVLVSHLRQLDLRRAALDNCANLLTRKIDRYEQMQRRRS